MYQLACHLLAHHNLVKQTAQADRDWGVNLGFPHPQAIAAAVLKARS